MNRSFFAGAGAGLAVGLLVALFAYQVGRAGGLLREREPTVAAPVANAPAPQNDRSAIEAHAAAARQRVQSDPNDREAWVALGNAYFDMDQPQQSIEAYGRALQLKAEDPNVLTDQGIMYVALRQYDKALANFQKANRLDPNHHQSLFNMGVAYAGLNDAAHAEEAWNKVIQMAPGTPDAERARAAIAQLREQKR